MNIANLDSGTRACVAVQAEAVMATLKAEAAKRMHAGVADPSQKIDEGSDANGSRWQARAALIFGTNREHKSARPG